MSEPIGFKISSGNLSFYGITKTTNLLKLLKHYVNRFHKGYSQKLNIIFKSSKEPSKIYFIEKTSNRQIGQERIMTLCNNDKSAINFSALSSEDYKPEKVSDKTDYYKNYYKKRQELKNQVSKPEMSSNIDK